MKRAFVTVGRVLTSPSRPPTGGQQEVVACTVACHVADEAAGLRRCGSTLWQITSPIWRTTAFGVAVVVIAHGQIVERDLRQRLVEPAPCEPLLSGTRNTDTCRFRVSVGSDTTPSLRARFVMPRT